MKRTIHQLIEKVQGRRLRAKRHASENTARKKTLIEATRVLDFASGPPVIQRRAIPVYVGRQSRGMRLRAFYLHGHEVAVELPGGSISGVRTPVDKSEGAYWIARSTEPLREVKE